MGGKLSNAQKTHKNDLMFLLRTAGYSKQLAPLVEKLLLYIELFCPFFPANGTLDVNLWDDVGAVLHKRVSASVQILRVWKICRNSIAELANPLLAPPPAFSAGPRLLPPAETPGVFLNGFKQPAVLLSAPPAAVSLGADVKPMLPAYSAASSPDGPERPAVKNLVAEVMKVGNSEEIADNLPVILQPLQTPELQITEPKCPVPSCSEIKSLGKELEGINLAPKSLVPSELATLSFNIVPEHQFFTLPPLSINLELVQDFSEGCNTGELPQVAQNTQTELGGNSSPKAENGKQLQVLNFCDKAPFISHCLPGFLSEHENNSFLDSSEEDTLLRNSSFISSNIHSRSMSPNDCKSLLEDDCQPLLEVWNPFQSRECLSSTPQPNLSFMVKDWVWQMFSYDPGKEGINPYSFASGNCTRMPNDFF